MTKPTLEELADRITGATAHSGGHLPADHAAAWAGYIAALLEWGLLTPHDHGVLLSGLPPSAAAAVLPIFLGPEVPAIATTTKQTTATRAAG
jgi:hypothetical protein